MLWWIIVVVVSDNEEEKSDMILISTVIMYMYNVSNVFISSVTIYVCGGGRSGGLLSNPNISFSNSSFTYLCPNSYS